MSAPVIIIDKPLVTETGEAEYIVGESVVLSMEDPGDGSIGQWNAGDGAAVRTGFGFRHAYSAAGWYVITAWFLGDSEAASVEIYVGEA